MSILVTAFDPFGGEKINPALEAVKALPAEIAGEEVITVEVPTVFGKAIEAATAAIEKHQPSAVLCVGQAGGRFDITPERVAINIDDARIPDNDGNQPIDEPVVDGAPSAYFATLPIKAMAAAIRDAGVPASVSNSAGTFVCNHIMYGVLHHLATEGPKGTRGGFVHVPFIPEQTVGKPGQPSLSTETITEGLTAAIRAIAENASDVATVEGTTH
ncbi:pyroglutamyl-peptidase I [Dermabacter hominis]|uniref:pyroglutamyl-peptidase I n=1 Tax=Dermabacter hominis TaxID=36740 RepID=UPI0021A6BBD6|nr:pyroglutamyl-peptidase I [Dermabacter hominis]MCT1716071.1 pyroglutamyl-peptidase I [Dermabacter hominis]MCT1789226.1 pyroglutamyl-peptidase I [Dermabacter hominis]MCT1955455.1 pyroglutamyl-peptidase I [Dermabacter hominis]MCT2056756.1 pyroglutamyl-peptidase I [Dermabacter hominis]MCT2084242.1 pyroglutamyl-peptidase I [Dermabacter hominis]